jgi:hypothetical protein
MDPALAERILGYIRRGSRRTISEFLIEAAQRFGLHEGRQRRDDPELDAWLRDRLAQQARIHIG